jgi:hypothetical protein
MLCGIVLGNTFRETIEATIMNFKKLIGVLFSPLVFGIGFVAPLAAQILTGLGYSAGIDNVYIGLAIGGSLGLMAQVRGSWVWVKP